MSWIRRVWSEKWFRRGLILLAIGCGPLLLVIAAAGLGLTDDPNPNPVGLGILAFLAFWPSVIMMFLGIANAAAAGKSG